ncbi:MAG: hypothetical protein AAGC55_08185, partial [Myxococcota bacterium]
MQSRIRLASQTDARAIARIHVDSWQDTYSDGLLPQAYLSRLSVPGLTERWSRRLTNPHFGDRTRQSRSPGRRPSRPERPCG